MKPRPVVYIAQSTTEGVIARAPHPTERLQNKMLNRIFNEFTMANMGNYKDIEWMNQIRKVTLN